jgi:hypothetical protein
MQLITNVTEDPAARAKLQQGIKICRTMFLETFNGTMKRAACQTIQTTPIYIKTIREHSGYPITVCSNSVGHAWMLLRGIALWVVNWLASNAVVFTRDWLLVSNIRQLVWDGLLDFARLGWEESQGIKPTAKLPTKSRRLISSSTFM